MQVTRVQNLRRPVCASADCISVIQSVRDIEFKEASTFRAVYLFLQIRKAVLHRSG